MHRGKIKIYVLSLFLLFGFVCKSQTNQKPPNILFAISDDQSFAHTSFAGSNFVNTPAFDKIAEEGVYFANCIAGSPGCAPSRSSIVTGRYPYQNEQAGQHASAWLKKYVPFIDVLEKVGYRTGRTGKGVGPFQYAEDEEDSLWRKTNAGGILHSDIQYDKDSLQNMQDYASGIKTTDYFGNFKYFIENVAKNNPFFFWFGAREPHRPFEKDSYKRMGKQLNSVDIPGFLPDNMVIRGDLLDYAVEVEWFDKQLGYMLDYLKEIGELENTVVIVTSDNGKAFPSAKANAYEYGIHVPLAIRYPKDFPGGRVIKDPVSFIDFAPTILDITGARSQKMMMPITGKSFLKTLQSKKEDFVKGKEAYALSGRERHSSSRYKNWGYPQRALRSRDYLFIWNMKPDRWPAGAPQEFNPDANKTLPLDKNSEKEYSYGNAYTDIDGSPTKDYLLKYADSAAIKPYFLMAVGKRPEFELFNINKDPYCLNNLAANPDYTAVKKKLKKELIKVLQKTDDPRVVGPNTKIFDTYKRYSHIRKFPNPKESNFDLKSKR